jgi:hypothetical protein
VSATSANRLIYALVDPRDGQWRYIGKSERGLKRPNHHYTVARFEHNHKAYWVMSLRRLGLRYGVEVLETLSPADDACEVEREWIAAARRAGVPLTNLTDGGEGTPGHKHSAETRQKLANRPPLSPEIRQRIADKLRGRPGRKHTPEARAKISARNRGRKWTPEQLAAITALRQTPEYRAKMAAAKRGKRRAPEVVAAMSARMLGKRPSAETRAKMRAAHAQRTPEQSERMVVGLRGGKQSPEHVAKRVASRRATMELC